MTAPAPADNADLNAAVAAERVRCAAIVDAQPDHGISYRSLWRISELIRAGGAPPTTPARRTDPDSDLRRDAERYLALRDSGYFAYGFDPLTGKCVWTLAGSADVQITDIDAAADALIARKAP